MSGCGSLHSGSVAAVAFGAPAVEELDGAHGVSGGGVPGLVSPDTSGVNRFRVHPTEHYFTLGTGYSLTGNMKLRLMYQIGTYEGLLGAPGLRRAYGR